MALNCFDAVEPAYLANHTTNRLLIVSNRLPVTARPSRGEFEIVSSSGGLATALSELHERGDSLWIGCPGDISRLDRNQRGRLNSHLAALRAAPVYLNQKEISGFYERFSNGVLWPLFHYHTDKVRRRTWQDWEVYVEVNRRFADAIAGHYREGDTIWVHDYHLMLLPALLRERIPGARIGFFLHIPFPSPEVFRILPWRDLILKGVLGADLIGFHVGSYLRHFESALIDILGLKVEGEQLRADGREIQLGVFPMGIDFKAFSSLADDSVESEVRDIKRECGGRKLLVGVDRLDYTKGLRRRLLAFERLLEREPDLRKKVCLLQLVVPSRTKIDDYDMLRRELDELVGRITGAYATFGSAPIHYLYRSISRRQLVALYRAADLMLVTPLRDGMNLVAKEFVASRNDDGGVLVLSEFAGAAAELKEAILVNPYDIDGLATAMKAALTMPDDEQRARMKAMQRRVMTHDVYRWARSFIETLSSIPAPGPLGAMSLKTDSMLASADQPTLLPDSDEAFLGYCAESRDGKGGTSSRGLSTATT